MAREEFDTCPKCGVGKMMPTGGAASATSADPDTNRLTGNSYQEYKCDSCGYPEGGQAKAVQVSDEQEGTGKSMNTTSRQQRQRHRQQRQPTLLTNFITSVPVASARSYTQDTYP